MADFSGKTVLVTGGSRGIGRAIVDAFAAAGAAVHTCGRGERPADLNASWRQLDVANAAAVQAWTGQFETIDVLVNNAGVQVEKTVADSTDADWDQVIGINARGVFNLCRAVIPKMRQGSIINIGSISGDVADPSMALYNASKAFVHGLTRSIAVDHGPAIRCNAVKPGWIMTGMADAAFALAHDPDKAQQDALARHAARRFGRPEDIAKTVLWLSSDAAEFVTGQCFTVDGGLTAASPLQPALF